MPMRLRRAFVVIASVAGIFVGVAVSGCGSREEPSVSGSGAGTSTPGTSAASGAAGMTPEAQAQMRAAQQSGAALRAAHSSAPSGK